MVLVGLHLVFGSVVLPWADFPALLSDPVYAQILWGLRLPEALTAVCVGAGLSVSGLQMQTLFGNPLAGPSILGISAGAGLGAAFWVLLEPSALPAMVSALGLVGLSVMGALGVLAVVVGVSFRLPDRVGLLLVGLMIGYLSGALVSLIQYGSRPEAIQRYLFWSFGDLAGLSWKSLRILLGCTAIGLVGAFTQSKTLNAWLLGENYARSMGLRLHRSRLIVIVLSGVLTGCVTAFVGPIGFVGIAVPHICRRVFQTSDHRVLLPAAMLVGAIFLLTCDLIAKLPGYSIRLPLNAVTALLGAPIVIWVIVRWRGASGGR